MRVLVVNVGSSSVKLRVLAASDEVLAAADLDADRGVTPPGELAAALDRLPSVDAVGHRIVHGGERFTGPARITDEVVAALADLVPLAPLHQPGGLAALRALRDARPELSAVACFDTAFHATLPAPARTYALPAEWRERFGLRRYGFHGLSHSWAASRAASLLGGMPSRLVVAHLGAGASLCAVADGSSVDTTMGFTPLEGLVMASRSGSVDPGIVTWLVQHGGLGIDEVADGLERRSGLAGLAGTPDLREVLARSGTDGVAGTDAALAVDVYVRAIRAGVAAMASALGGLDALVFTGGVGEHAAAIRARVGEACGFLGVRLDAARNDAARPDVEISADGAPVRTLVVTAREDLRIAGEVRSTLS